MQREGLKDHPGLRAGWEGHQIYPLNLSFTQVRHMVLSS